MMRRTKLTVELTLLYEGQSVAHEECRAAIKNALTQWLKKFEAVHVDADGVASNNARLPTAYTADETPIYVTKVAEVQSLPELCACGRGGRVYSYYGAMMCHACADDRPSGG